MDQKGSSILVLLIEIIVVVSTGFFLSNIAVAYADSEYASRIKLVEDSRIMAEGLLGMPGDALVSYQNPANTSVVVFSQGKVSVFKKGDPEGAKLHRLFYVPPGYTTTGAAEQAVWLCFEKKSQNILLRGCLSGEMPSESLAGRSGKPSAAVE